MAHVAVSAPALFLLMAKMVRRSKSDIVSQLRKIVL
jgi:hypothetical protein